MESQATNSGFIEQSVDAPQWSTYEPNDGSVIFDLSLLSCPGRDVLDYSGDSYFLNGAHESVSESEVKRQRREKDNLASPKLRAVKKERFAAMTEKIAQLQAENHHLRCVVHEMDSVIYEAKGMVMQANQLFP